MRDRRRLTVFYDTGVQFFVLDRARDAAPGWGGHRAGSYSWTRDRSQHRVAYTLDRAGRRVAVAIDTRSADNVTAETIHVCPPGPDPEPMAVVELRPPEGPPVRTELIVDLGNSRTSCVAIEEPAGDDELQGARCIWAVELQNPATACAGPELFPPSEMEAVPGLLESKEAYELAVSTRVGLLARLRRDPLVAAELDFVVPPHLSDWPPGPFAIGREAVDWRQETGLPSPLRTGRSSPKRYLWKHDPNQERWRRALANGSLGELEGWLVTSYPSEAAFAPRGLQPSGDLAAMPHHYSTSRLTSLFLVEVARMSHRFLNSHAHRERTRSEHRRRVISRVFLTYPSAMIPAEKEILERQLSTCIEVFRKLRPEACTGDVAGRLLIDEGTASLYAFSRSTVSDGLGADIGVPPGRRAVLDFGGGTVDLCLAEVEADSQEISLHSLLIDGIRRGGDDVVLEIVKMLFSSRRDVLGDESAGRIGEIAARSDADRMRLLRHLLVPLAIDLLVSSNTEKAVLSVDSRRYSAAQQDLELPPLKSEISVEWKRVYGCVRDVLKGQLEELCERSLGSAGRAECVYVSGALSRSAYVKAMLSEIMPGTEVVSYGSSERLVRLARGVFGEASRDPKCTAALGAALFRLGSLGRDPSGYRLVHSAPKASAERLCWGVIRPDSGRVSEVVFTGSEPAEATAEVVCTGRCLLGWTSGPKMSLGELAQPGYLLAGDGPNRASVTARMRRSESGLELVGPPDDIRLSLHTLLNEEDYWLDSVGLEELTSEGRR